MVIAELFETGLFDMFLYFSEPYVWIPAYSCLVLGMIVQFILAKKCHKKVWRMSVLELGFIGILLCECIWHTKAGFGRLIVDMICLLLTSLLIGAMIAVAVSFLREKWGSYEMNNEIK